MLVEAGASLGENDDTEEQEVVTAAVKSKDEDVMDVVLEGFLYGSSQREVRGTLERLERQRMRESESQRGLLMFVLFP